MTLEVAEAPPEYEHRVLEGRLNSARGIALTVCYGAKNTVYSRGLLPARPGMEKLVHEPVLY